MKKSPFLIILMVVLSSCMATKTALFDHYSYQKTTEIKVETSNLMDKSSTSYTDNKIAIEKLLLEVQKLIEYEKNKPNNEITFAMWTILNDKEKNLLAGFFSRWQEKEKLSPAFAIEAKKQTMEALDLLIQYEVKKDKESANLLLDLIKTK
ncbi:hypothetical protein [Flavobacterium sp.]|uniref:hypothetical protein n=1 Tax=Flavobacterium sp. TaxID=239 RepID=UPI002630556F|nr:hypothetical protein [Flavobacterium sp.]